MSNSYYANYNDVIDQLTAYGLQVDVLEIDSHKPKRCPAAGDQRKEKRGWYWLSSLTTGAENLIVGGYGIYCGNDNGKQTVTLSKDKRDRLSPAQIEAQKARQQQARKRAALERLKEADRAAALASKNWKKALLDGSSEYLQRKQIEPFGIRFTATGALVIPMTADDSIRGLQIIYPKGHDRQKKLGRDKEFWPAGLQMAGTYHLIGQPKEILLVAEGYATAASLHQATGLPVAVVWSANNILPACQALQKKHRRARLLICADDDYLQKCSECKQYTLITTETCQHCGQPHRKSNAGTSNAQAAAVAVNGSWIIPRFSHKRPTDAKGATDFNDLHVIEGLAVVADQLDAQVAALGWLQGKRSAASEQGGGGKSSELKSMLTIDEALERFALVYGGKGTMFDNQEHILIPKTDVLDILPEHGWRDMRAIKKVVRLEEVGFDPSGTDPRVKCNLWGGWPTEAKKGKCESLLELLEYLCSNEENQREAYQWVLKWLAYPLQHPGSKMRTALIFHGPQGTGKNLFFESIMAIYGEYGRIVDQSAIEDKFNDWASKKLFLIADEVVARTELFHIKNKLKCFVTGEWIRINPKNVSAHDERNHVNLVFLSNESQPLVLEKDDRRYTVIHTPEKLPEEFYHLVKAEINAGGVAALHHYLLNLDLGSFDEHTKPPLTKAKNDLIEVSMDSISSFLQDWTSGEISKAPCCPCLGTHLYATYRRYCDRVGETKPRILRQFIGSIKMLSGWKAGQPATTLEHNGSSHRVSRKMIIPPEDLVAEQHRKTVGQSQEQWLTEGFLAFARSGDYEI